MTSLKFENILVFAHPRIPQESLKDSIEVLLRTLSKFPTKVTLESETAKILKQENHPTLSIHDPWDTQDLIISVGGDGTLLQAGRKAALDGLPIVGINRGKLGFLTDILPNDIDRKISEILTGHYREEARSLLQATDAEEQNILAIGLNDIVFFAGDHLHMIDLEVLVNQEPVFELRGDGLIIATPTGSTAYSLSAGGSILYPQISAINLIPMYPHTLNNRPIVLEGSCKIGIHIEATNTTRPRMSADGQPYMPLNPGSKILISIHPKQLRLLHPMDYNYFETLRSKLNWQIHHTCSSN